MRFQFTTSALLLFVTFICVCLGSVFAMRTIVPDEWPMGVTDVAFWSPLWLPLVFVGYAAGKRSMTWPIVLCLTAGEVAALFLVVWITHHTFLR